MAVKIRTCPGCGETFRGSHKLGKHKALCEALENAVYDEIYRIADELGRAPTAAEYDELSRPDLPKRIWIYYTYGNWVDLLAQLDLKQPRRGSICHCGFDVYSRGLCRAHYQKWWRDNRQVTHE